MPLPVRGRYAPSPTGELHLGNVRTALLAWLGARAAGGSFVLRVEDLDPPRVIPGAEQRILDDLRWLGIDWDEGPDVGGPHGPYRQSEAAPVFHEALTNLRDAGRLYGCTCSRADLKRLASAPHAGEGEPVYPGICRTAGHPIALAVTVDPRIRQPALRFAVAPGTVVFADRLAGRYAQDVQAEVGDFVVRRADGLYAYQLAVVADDLRMGINQVVRGADLLDSTPRQIQLIEALGGTPPVYAHVPLALDMANARLSKRDRATAVRDLRERGVAPEQLIGLLGYSLGLLSEPGLCSARDLVPAFAWERVELNPWRFDPSYLL